MPRACLGLSGTLNYASPGVGTPHHLAMELFKGRAGVDLAHAPYRGLAGAVTDVVAGQVVAMFIHTPPAVALRRDERVRVVAVKSDARLPYLADMPTLAEGGMRGVIMRDWYGLFAPAGTPPEIVARLNDDANAVLSNPDAVRTLVSQGYEIVGGTVDAFHERVAIAVPRWAAVVRDAGITAEWSSGHRFATG